MPDEILNRFDDITREDLNKVDDADKAELLQKCIVATCESTLKKVGCATNKMYANYSWSPKIAELRAQTNKALRKITRGRKKESSDQHLLVNAYKEARRLLKKEIAQSKARAWTEYCRILENDPWGEPYRVVTNRCKTKGPVSDMPISSVKNILSELFTIGHRSS